MKILLLEENKEHYAKIKELSNHFTSFNKNINLYLLKNSSMLFSKEININDVLILGLPVKNENKILDYLSSIDFNFSLIIISEENSNINNYLKLGTFGCVAKDDLANFNLKEIIYNIYRIYLESISFVIQTIDNKYVKISVNNIAYIQIENRNVVVTATDSNKIILKTRSFNDICAFLKNINLTFEELNFIYIYKAKVVNLKYIKKIINSDSGTNILLKNNKILGIANDRIQDIKNKFSNYIKYKY